jgi:glycolate oxidase FAD binding subunit
VATVGVQRHAPASADEIAELLAASAARGGAVRPRGGGTRSGWGHPLSRPADVELSTERLDAIVAHNVSDLTAVVQAGVTVATAQRAFAEHGQMLGVDAPLDDAGAATIGGLVATADSGPLRHAYRAVRDLVLGVRVALPDGTVARAGSDVIKNVAGYDLAKLLTGSFGTLGVICEVSIRLHPRPAATATAVARGDDPAALAAAAVALAHAPLEAISLDVAWADGAGEVTVRMAGETAGARARSVVGLLGERGLEAAVDDDDEPRWARQRAGQRSTDRTVVRVSTTNRGLAGVLEAAQRIGARAVGRGGLGLVWLTLPEAGPEEAAGLVGELRAQLAPAPCVVLDAPEALRAALDPWGAPADGGAIELMRRVKARFDPQGACNPGLYAGGI